MITSARMPPHPSPHKTVSQPAFDRLLERLGADRDAAAHEYGMLRCRLVDFFDGRGAESPDVLADETLDRMARKLEEGEAIEHVRAYAYGVAKRLFLEEERRRGRAEAALRELRRAPVVSPAPAILEARIACLQRCLQELPDDSRSLIISYYEGAGEVHLADRKLLAQRLGLAYVTLKTRAFRIRARLEECLRTCLAAQDLGNQ
jgi:DNA-directed RNA polymerase specialized sigma24 family protein